ncbi:hypothetical protein AVEN_29497-1 [Araneus ventricosus]|uniref:Uncharacterized protein n=1 Tax=Araneus ventricosus TaxID=182803 RepID=A0A4Y2SLX8_ARAVE|nr:hypothetical protein AVEN_29497-1 [Araneus ventricosus]
MFYGLFYTPPTDRHSSLLVLEKEVTLTISVVVEDSAIQTDEQMVPRPVCSKVAGLLLCKSTASLTVALVTEGNGNESSAGRVAKVSGYGYLHTHRFLPVGLKTVYFCKRCVPCTHTDSCRPILKIVGSLQAIRSLHTRQFVSVGFTPDVHQIIPGEQTGRRVDMCASSSCSLNTTNGMLSTGFKSVDTNWCVCKGPMKWVVGDSIPRLPSYSVFAIVCKESDAASL